MQLCKVRLSNSEPRAGVLADGQVRLMKADQSLSAILHAKDPSAAARAALDPQAPPLPAHQAAFLPPVEYFPGGLNGIISIMQKPTRFLLRWQTV